MANGVFNQDSRNRILQRKQDLSQFSDQEIEEAIQARQGELGGQLGGTLQGVGNVFLGLGGAQGIPQQAQESQFDQLIKLQTAEVQQRLNEEKLLKAQQDREIALAKAKQEAVTKDVEAKKRAEIEGGAKPVKPEGRVVTPLDSPSTTVGPPVPLTATLQQESLPTQASGLQRTKATVGSGDIKETFEDISLKLSSNVAKAAALDDIEEGTKIEAGQRLALNNVNILGTTGRNVAEAFADALSVGQAGDIGAAFKVNLAEKLNINIGEGETIQDKFGREGTELKGVINEMLLKLMPMLTQQGEKPGSVRLIQSIVERVGGTLPSLKTGPLTARSQITRTLKSFYGFARSAEIAGLDFDTFFRGKDQAAITDNEFDSWTQKVNAASRRIDRGPEEERALNSFLNNSIEPLDIAIAERMGGVLMEDPETGVRAIVKDGKVVAELD